MYFMTNIEPLSDRLLVRPDEPEQKTTSGILIPPTSQQDSQQGTVLAVGPECSNLSVGEIIIYSRYGTTKIKVDGVELLILRVADVLARVGESTKS
jgi:chaperonin GroES